MIECNLGETIYVSEIITELNKKAYKSQMVPIGSIIMYYGNIAELPSNWIVCDGTNGTPDLRNMFIQGTNIEAEIGDIGGNKDIVNSLHSHTMTIDENGTHNHDVTMTDENNHVHTGSVGSELHTHNMFDTSLGWVPSGYYELNNHALVNPDTPLTTLVSGEHVHGFETLVDGGHTHEITMTIENNHTHTVNISDSGEDPIDKNLPPYTYLHYIKRIS